MTSEDSKSDVGSEEWRGSLLLGPGMRLIGGIGVGLDQDVPVRAGNVQGKDFFQGEEPVADFCLIHGPCELEIARGFVTEHDGLIEVALNISDYILERYLAILQSSRNPLRRFGFGCRYDSAPPT